MPHSKSNIYLRKNKIPINVQYIFPKVSYQPPPKRHNLPVGLGGGDGRIPSGAERKSWGCNYHEVDDDDDDDDDNGKGGKQGKWY